MNYKLIPIVFQVVSFSFDIIRYSSARSAHLLRRPYENIVPVGIQPIAKRFSMAGCRLQFSWLNSNYNDAADRPAFPVPAILI